MHKKLLTTNKYNSYKNIKYNRRFCIVAIKDNLYLFGNFAKTYEEPEMLSVKKYAVSLAFGLSMASLAYADATHTITSTGTTQIWTANSGQFEIGRVNFEYGTQSITSLSTAATLKDQGWGYSDPSNGLFVQLLSNNSVVYSVNVASASHEWQTQSFNLASNAANFNGINLALANINRADGPIALRFLTNAIGYQGWELRTLNDSLSVSTSFKSASPMFAVSALSSIQAVPEPETYAMMLFGLGAIGLMKRRKDKAAG